MGCVYFYKQNNLSPIKIGMSHSDNPHKRIATFETGAPYGGELLGYFTTKTPKKDEKAIHEIFKEERLYPNREWFDITVDEALEVGREFIRRRSQKIKK